MELRGEWISEMRGIGKTRQPLSSMGRQMLKSGRAINE